jgi:2'-5' RNA ligase
VTAGVRLFVALDLPENARAELARLELDANTWRRVNPETLHITLAFLGTRPEDDVATIGPIVEREAGQRVQLAFRRLLLLPPRRARVLTVELESAGLAELQARISAALHAAGVYTPEKRPFRAHVTVARLKPRADPPRAVESRVEPLAFPGTAITLYVSRLHPSGARYEPLVRAPLAVI